MIKIGDLVIADTKENDIRYRTWQKLSIYSSAKNKGVHLYHPELNEAYLVIDDICADMIDFIDKSHYRHALIGQKFVRCLAPSGKSFIFPALTLRTL
jgi:hypothetical protein